MSNHRSASPSQRSPTSPAADEQVLPGSRAALLERLQQLLGYQFHDPARLDLALTHSSVAYEEQSEQHSER